MDVLGSVGGRALARRCWIDDFCRLDYRDSLDGSVKSTSRGLRVHTRAEDFPGLYVLPLPLVTSAYGNDPARPAIAKRPRIGQEEDGLQS